MVEPGADFLAEPGYGVAGVFEFAGRAYHAVELQLQQLPGFHIRFICGDAVDERLGGGGDIDRFFAEIAVAIRQQVGIVGAEYLHGFAVARVKSSQACFPGGD